MEEQLLNPTKFNQGPSLLTAVFNAKVHAQAEKFAQEEKRRNDRENRTPGVSDWPEWLKEASKSRLQQARNARVRHTTKLYVGERNEAWRGAKRRAVRTPAGATPHHI